MQFTFRSQFLLAALLLFCTEGRIRAADSHWIVKDGRSNAQIVTSADPPRTVRLAALELQHTLQQMSGAAIPIVSSEPTDEGVKLFVGISKFTQARGITNDGLEHGAFRIVAKDNWIAFVGADVDYQPVEPWGHDHRDDERVLAEWDEITGETFGNVFTSMWRKHDDRETGLWEFDLDNAGSFNAVAHFLRGLGVRWYMPGKLGTFIPKKSDIALLRINQMIEPDFALRNIYQFGTNFFSSRQDEILWQMRLGLNQGQGLISFGPNNGVAHGIKHVVSRDETKTAHPDMYMLRGGKRTTEEGIPCLRSEKLIAAQVRYLRHVFDHYDVPMQSVMPTDGFGKVCSCDKCKDEETPERGTRGSLSDYVWEYVVRVADELAKTHPDRKVHCLAYTTYQLPPTKIDKLPVNVVVGIAQNRSYFRIPKLQQLQHEIREGWLKKITSDVGLYQYEYYLQGWSSRPWHGLPILYPNLIVEDLRSLKGQSIGEYVEYFRLREPTPTNLLNAYVTARYYWDTQQDLNVMLDEYHQRMFGPAAKPMRAFYQLAENRYYQLEAADIEQLRDYLATAERLAGESDHGERIARIRTAVTQGLNRHYARLRDFDEIALQSFDVVGFDAASDEALLDYRPFADIMGTDTEPSERTRAALAWTDDALLVRVKCEESDMSSLRTFAPDNQDASIFRDDAVQIVIVGEDGDLHELLINPKGIWAGIDRSRQGLDGLGWSPAVNVKAKLEKDHWFVEVKLPADALSMQAPNKEAPWRINVGRVRPRGYQRDLSSLAPTGYNTLLHADRTLRVYLPSEEVKQ